MGAETARKESVKNAFRESIEPLLKRVLNDLRDSIDKNHRFNASKDKFKLWTRDICFGSFGLIESGIMIDEVKHNLEIMLDNVRKDGLAPLHIGHYYNTHYHIFKNKRLISCVDRIIRLFGVDNYNKPRFSVRQSWYKDHVALDNNALLVITASEYYKKTKDTGFLKKNYDILLDLVNWYFHNTKNKKIELDHIFSKPQREMKRCIDFLSKRNILIYCCDSSLATWEDSCKKKGDISYIEVLYLKMLEEISYLSKESDNEKNAFFYEKLAKRGKDIFISGLWEKERGHLIDWEEEDELVTSFDTVTNLLAIRFDILDIIRGKRIIEFIESLGLDKKGPILLRHPCTLAKGHVDKWYNFVGMHDYHCGETRWPWVEYLYISVLFRLSVTIRGEDFTSGEKYFRKAEDRLNSILSNVDKKGITSETTDDMYHLKKWKIFSVIKIHESQENFFWSEGMLLGALNDYREARGVFTRNKEPVLK